MTDLTGLVVKGDDHANDLTVNVVHEENGDLSIYNVIEGGGGSDKLHGEPATDEDIILKYGVQIFGDAGADKIWGSKAADTINGGADDDKIYYSGGADVIDGGDGEDSFWYPATGAIFSLDQLTITGVEKLVVSSGLKVGDFELSAFSSITSLAAETSIIFTQQATIEDLTFTGSSRVQWNIKGSKFDDHLDFSSGVAIFDVNGGLGNDLIIGGTGGNTFHGNDGNDTLIGGKTQDAMDGGDGDDLLSGGGGKDRLEDVLGNNTIQGGAGDDLIFSGAGNDRILGDAGNDLIWVRDGKDVVDGGTGNDTFQVAAHKSPDLTVLRGGNGNDHFVLERLADGVYLDIHGGEGKDTLTAWGNISGLKIKAVETLDLAEADTLTADADVLDSFDRIINGGWQLTIKLSSGGHLTWSKTTPLGGYTTLLGSNDMDIIDISASPDFKTVKGGKGDDVITGSASTASTTDIYGGDGNDRLIGGRGVDRLEGGKGDDTFIASAGFDTMLGGAGKDTFVFGNNVGWTLLYDYDTVGADRDIIDLSGVRAIKDFDDMIHHHIGTPNVGDVVVIYTDHGTIELFGAKISDLDESAFIF